MCGSALKPGDLNSVSLQQGDRIVVVAIASAFHLANSLPCLSCRRLA